MRSKSIVLLALALGCGLVASIGISQVMERRNQSPSNAGETELIFVALNDINANEPLSAQNIKTEEWPKAKVPTGAVTKLEQLENMRARQKLFQGEPLITAKLIDANEVNGASTGIPKGFRVVSVRVDAVSGTGSLILPDDRVDVLVFLSRNPAHEIFETQTKTILQDVKVFAVDTAFTRDPGNGEPAIAAKTISLLVLPEQAEKVMLASEMGSIRLILRNDTDGDIAETDGTQASEVMGTSPTGDRDAEHKKATPPSTSPAVTGIQEATKSLLDLIRERQKAQAATTSATPAPTPSQGPWKMTLIKGSDLQEVSIDSEGIPSVVGTASGSTSSFSPSTQNNLDSTNSNDPNSSSSTGSGFSPDPSDPPVSLEE